MTALARVLRTSRGWLDKSAAELAADLRLSLRQLQRIEAGESTSPDRAQQILALLRSHRITVGPNWICCGDAPLLDAGDVSAEGGGGNLLARAAALLNHPNPAVRERFIRRIHLSESDGQFDTHKANPVSPQN